MPDVTNLVAVPATPAPAKSTWDRVGSIFASIAKGAAAVALWASQHPEVVQVIEAVAVSRGASPRVISAIDTGVKVGGAVAGQIENR